MILMDTVERVLDLLFTGRDVIYGLGGQVVVGGPEYEQALGQ